MMEVRQMQTKIGRKLARPAFVVSEDKVEEFKAVSKELRKEKRSKIAVETRLKNCKTDK